jgi:hypothetical protein
MSDAIIFQIEDGEFGLKLVDKAAVGYLETWQAPAGKAVDAVVMADYEADADAWTCQVTSGALTAAPDTTTQDIPATLCAPGKSTPTPKETAYTLDLSFLQDPNVSAGLSRYLFEHDTKEAYVYFGMDGVNPPKMIGRVRLVSGTVGGGARTILTADTSLPLVRKPDVEFGDATTSVVVKGDGTAPVLAAAGTTRKGTRTTTED